MKPIRDKEKTITLFIIDDEILICQSLSFLLDTIEGFKVTGFAVNGDDAIRELACMEPEVILMDIRLKNENGLVLTEKIRKDYPLAKILIVSSYCNESLILMAAGAGASGYTTKTMKIDELVTAIKAIIRSPQFYLHPEIKDMADNVSIEMVQKTPGKTLTQREMEILVHIAWEYSTRDIAEKLGISEKTVRNHKSNIMQKLNVKCDAGLIKHAYNLALI